MVFVVVVFVVLLLLLCHSMLHLLPSGVYENGILRHANVDMKMPIIIGLCSLGAASAFGKEKKKTV